jgi:hypothetical protein
MELVAKLQARLHDNIPRAVRSELCEEISLLITGAWADTPQRHRNNSLLWIFPKLVLARCGGNTTAAIRRRLRLWRERRYNELFAEATAAAEIPEREATGHPVQEVIGQFFTNAGEHDLPESVKLRVDKLMDRGLFGKAMAALSQAKLAQVSEENLQMLREKHPRAYGSPLAEVLVHPQPAPPEMTINILRKALQSFARGCAPGPSGMTADLLRILSALPASGERLMQSLLTMCNKCISGNVGASHEHATAFFAAKLIALEKSDGGLRPVAMGEVLRRLTAKTLMIASKEKARAIFARVNQFAVGSPNAIPFLGLVAQQATERIAELREAHGTANPPDPQRVRALFKGDISNAFNAASRAKILAAAATHFPELFPFISAGYAAPTPLYFGKHTISSEEGSQQGDVHGTFLFGLAVLEAYHHVRDRMEAIGVPMPLLGSEAEEPDAILLHLRAFFADDLLLSGSVAELQQIVVAFAEEFRAVGLEFNMAKCQIIAHPDDFEFIRGFSETFNAMQLVDLSAWEYLGIPIGSRAWREEYTANYINRYVTSRLDLIQKYGEFSPHQALALLQSVAGWSQCQFLAQSLGPCPAFETYDRALRNCCGAIFEPASDQQWEMFTLPKKLGGLGLRSCSALSAFAFLGTTAKALAAWPIFRLLPPQTDSWEAAAYSPVVSPNIFAMYSDGDAATATSRNMSGAYEAEKLERLLQPHGLSQSELLLAKVQLAAGSADWQSCSVADSVTRRSSTSFFLPARDARLVFALRMGSSIGLRGACPFCRNCEVSVSHLLSCMHGGARQIMHSSLKAAVGFCEELAGYSVHYEALPFGDGRRIDILSTRGNATTLIDVAITNPLATNHSMEMAPGTPSIAATHYERVKHAMYGAAATELGFPLVPFVVDVFGGLGQSACAHLQGLAARVADRNNMPRSAALALLRSIVASAMARGLAMLLRRAIEGNTVNDDSSAHEDTVECIEPEEDTELDE